MKEKYEGSNIYIYIVCTNYKVGGTLTSKDSSPNDIDQGWPDKNLAALLA